MAKAGDTLGTSETAGLGGDSAARGLRQLGDFLGLWRLERDITHADGTRASFRGTAHWQAEGSGALCIESGTLTTGGQSFAAERRYLWDADLAVRFDDGRFFHQVPAAGGEATHWCDPDDYRVTYVFDEWPLWQAVWRVCGPRKDYELLSRYTVLTV